jgi:hypothetical protein
MILGWSPSKIVSVSAVLYPRWPPWLKIECTASPDTILELDTLVMIQTKFGFHWSSTFRGEDFWKSELKIQCNVLVYYKATCVCRQILCRTITWVVFLIIFLNFISCLLVKRGGSLSFLTIFTFAVPELLDLIWRKPPYNFAVGGIDGRTDMVKPVYPPTTLLWGYKNDWDQRFNFILLSSETCLNHKLNSE